MANTCTINVGRLVEIRARSGYRTLADVNAFFRGLNEALVKVPPAKKVVVVTDWRFCPIMAGDAAEQMVSKIKMNNPRVERSGAIASANSPSAVLQFIRLVRESGHHDRRLFEEQEALIAWLSECLNAQEVIRLRAFLNEK
jgi:hypothetical protein